MTAELCVTGAFIPKGAKNVEVAKDFLKYVIQPKISNEYLKNGLGRWLPAHPETVKTDPFWLNGGDPHVAAYAKEGAIDPTVPNYPCFNPGYAEANAQQVWGTAAAEVIRDGATPQAAAEKALARIGQILAKYPIAQS
jgi:multiple sugar transport system substrate-binding protein